MKTNSYGIKILVCGTRGIPGIAGGVETHCEALFPILQSKGVDVTICRRSAYITHGKKLTDYKGVKLVDLFSPRKKSFEAIVHTLLAVWHARWHGYKIVHVHAIGPALAIPLARLLGLKVVMTHHGADYERQKWGRLGKFSLKMGEWCAVRMANEVIVISQPIRDLLKSKHRFVRSHLIPNGVTIQSPSTEIDYLQQLGLKKHNYVIAVGRFVPEKGYHDLLEAWKSVSSSAKLVLVGDADHGSIYSRQLKGRAAKMGVVLTGYITGENLRQIYSHAALFVMPSYHEGLPIALLEAMSYSLKIVVSDIPANLEVGLPPDNYFHTGDTANLAQKITRQLTVLQRPDYQNVLKKNYNWETIAEQTSVIYQKLTDKSAIGKGEVCFVGKHKSANIDKSDVL